MQQYDFNTACKLHLIRPHSPSLSHVQRSIPECYLSIFFFSSYLFPSFCTTFIKSLRLIFLYNNSIESTLIGLLPLLPFRTLVPPSFAQESVLCTVETNRNQPTLPRAFLLLTPPSFVPFLQVSRLVRFVRLNVLSTILSSSALFLSRLWRRRSCD